MEEEDDTDGHSTKESGEQESVSVTVELEMEHRGSTSSRKPIILADSMETDV